MPEGRPYAASRCPWRVGDLGVLEPEAMTSSAVSERQQRAAVRGVGEAADGVGEDLGGRAHWP